MNGVEIQFAFDTGASMGLANSQSVSSGQLKGKGKKLKLRDCNQQVQKVKTGRQNRHSAQKKLTFNMLSEPASLGPIQQFFSKRHTSLSFMLRYSPRKFSQKGFHRFRVEIKKLKALIAFLEEQVEDFPKKKIYPPIKALYIQAGQVRELQIEKDLINSQIQPGDLPDFLRRLHAQIQMERADFLSLKTLKCRKKIEKSLLLLQKEIKGLKGKNLTPNLKQYRDGIVQLIKKGINSHNAHQLRIQLKLLKNSQEMLQISTQSESGLLETVLMKLLGEWHDRDVFVRRMKNSDWKTHLNPNEKKSLQRIINTVDRHRKLLLAEIQVKADELLP